MATGGLTLRPAAGSMGYLERLLEGEGLPTADLREDSNRFYLAEREGEHVGGGGLELYGDVGLLRSVAVEPEHRDRGLGGALVAALEAEARDAGVESLFLLTDTAAGFFEHHGYVRVDRDEAPAAIQDTREFAELCGGSAVCMRKSI